jgi:hypothetical protein
MLVVPPTEHVVRGFLLETTSEKDRVYLWRVVAPLLRPMGGVVLDYSSRVSGSELELYIRREAFEESVEKVLGIISEHIEYLRGVRHPHDFLRHASWIVDGSPLLARFDQALIHYVIGNVPHGIKSLRALNQEADGWDARRRQYIGPLLKRIVRQIDEDPAGLMTLLQEWEDQNIERLGLAPSRTLSHGPKLVASR